MNADFIYLRRAYTEIYRAIRSAHLEFEEIWKEDHNQSKLNVSFEKMRQETLNRLSSSRNFEYERLIDLDLLSMTLLLRYDHSALEFAENMKNFIKKENITSLRELVEKFLIPVFYTPKLSCYHSRIIQFEPTLSTSKQFLEFHFTYNCLYVAFRICAFPLWSTLDCTGLINPQNWLRFSSNGNIQYTIEKYARKYFWPLEESPIIFKHPTPIRPPSLLSPPPPALLKNFSQKLLTAKEVKLGNYSPRSKTDETDDPARSPTTNSGFASALQYAMNFEVPKNTSNDSKLLK